MSLAVQILYPLMSVNISYDKYVCVELFNFSVHIKYSLDLFIC